MEVNFELIVGNKNQTEVLYTLLSGRQHKISHQQMPSYAEHERFVASHPYRAWFLVKFHENYVGTVYITDRNSIGVNVKDDVVAQILPLIFEKICSDFPPLPEIKSLRSGHFSVSVAPSNKTLAAALEGSGLRLAQLTYVL
jgi:hypothetical protein